MSAAAIAAVVTVAALTVCWPLVTLTIDDAFITFRQAERLVAGSWSYRTTVPVEASSSLLMTLLIAALHSTGIAAETASKLIGGAALVVMASTAGAVIAARRAGTTALAWLLPFAAAVASPWMAAWWFMGLETPLWAALLFVMAAAVSTLLVDGGRRPRWIAAGASMAACLTRPEAPIVLVVWLLSIVIIAPWARRDLVRLMALVAVTAVAVGVFRLAVYDQWFPNPVYVKTPTSLASTLIAGAKYVGAAVVAPWQTAGAIGGTLLVLLAAAATPWIAPWARALGRRDAATAALRRAWPAASLAGLQVLFAVGVGGDWMPWGRFLVSVPPLLALALVSIGAPIVSRALALVLLAGTVATSAAVVRVEGAHGLLAEMRTDYDQCWRPMATVLRTHGHPAHTLAVGDIGLPGYQFPGDVIDFFGLANPALARRPVSGATADDVLGARPEWALVYAGGVVTDEVWPLPQHHYATTLMRVLLADGRLRADYQVVSACHDKVLVRRR